MCDDHDFMSPDDPEYRVTAFFGGGLLGGVLGGLAFWLFQLSPVYLWCMVGAVFGSAFFLAWPSLHGVWRKLSLGHWGIKEIPCGPITITCDSHQRRAAWRIFFEMVSRIAIRPMDDDLGDDGAALTSLKNLFDECRKIVCGLEDDFVPKTNTVETYTLEMLNSQLAPFLSAWHPKWDSWKRSQEKAGESVDSSQWGEHSNFRNGLRELQDSLRERARDFAKVAGVMNAESRFIAPKKTSSGPT